MRKILMIAAAALVAGCALKTDEDREAEALRGVGFSEMGAVGVMLMQRGQPAYVQPAPVMQMPMTCWRAGFFVHCR